MNALPTRKKVFDLEGEAQQNPDGHNRQEELLIAEPGEPVRLKREPDNHADPNAILVLSARGVPIGYVNRTDAPAIASAMDGGRTCRAKLHCVRGGIAGYPNYGARISIAWDGRPEHPHLPLDEEQLRARRQKTGSRTAGSLGRREQVTSKALRSVRRIEAGRGLAAHILVFSAAALAIYAFQLDHELFLPMLGWLFGLLLHALIAFGPGQWIGRRWEDRKLRGALGKLQDLRR
ncbi:MAG TPA: HIRAN domain-containing protein [Allosphingosinicella sp.]|uniref:HIRAN domain-containing protein n=1 Tax=Allosphingosinicella sp. TaxID=2823234 RepID=UPI002EDAAC76